MIKLRAAIPLSVFYFRGWTVGFRTQITCTWWNDCIIAKQKKERVFFGLVSSRFSLSNKRSYHVRLLIGPDRPFVFSSWAFPIFYFVCKTRPLTIHSFRTCSNKKSPFSFGSALISRYHAFFHLPFHTMIAFFWINVQSQGQVPTNERRVCISCVAFGSFTRQWWELPFLFRKCYMQ